MSPDEFRSGDPMAAIRDLARDLDAKWPDMHRDPVPPFSSGEDAHEAAWDRESYGRAQFNERRNESERVRRLRVKEAFALQDGTEAGRKASKSLLLFSVWECGQIEGLEDMPPLTVAFR